MAYSSLQDGAGNGNSQAARRSAAARKAHATRRKMPELQAAVDNATRLYQGCGGEVAGQREPVARRRELDRLEASGDWLAEPKFDGIWIAAVNESAHTAPPILYSRSGKVKHIPALSHVHLPPHTILVGELAYGSQDGVRRRNAIGHDFMDVFDILRFQGDPVRELERADRQSALDEFYRVDSEYAEYYRRAPCWTADFVKRYMAQSEGLVLKPINDPPYDCIGGRALHWMKAKKCMIDEYVIVDWERSTADSKVERSMAKCMICGGYVPSSTANGSRVYDVIDIDGEEYNLIALVNVGSMQHTVSESIANHFNRWYGKVISVGHFGRFDSGSCRHPFVANAAAEQPWIREDKEPTECLFRV